MQQLMLCHFKLLWTNYKHGLGRYYSLQRKRELTSQLTAEFCIHILCAYVSLSARTGSVLVGVYFCFNKRELITLPASWPVIIKKLHHDYRVSVMFVWQSVHTAYHMINIDLVTTNFFLRNHICNVQYVLLYLFDTSFLFDVTGSVTY